jgi:hypothetical protein
MSIVGAGTRDPGPAGGAPVNAPAPAEDGRPTARKLRSIGMKNVAKQILHLMGRATAPVFKIEAIRRYAMNTIAANTFKNYSENCPTLNSTHLNGAKLVGTREDLISDMSFLKGGVIAEIGVADGFFSDFLLSELQPRKFVAFDIFTMHEFSTSFAGRTNVFSNMTQLEHYRRKFADRGPQVVIEVGKSQQNLAKYPDKSFDLIYIDGDHSYAGVNADANLAKAKITDKGVVVFNDYIIYDYIFGEFYGVVRAVNELLTNEDWRVYGFALASHMYCDIALRKRVHLVSD